MLPLFTAPLAFLAALAIPVLVGIYWFRSKFRRQVVSSLMLWMNQKEARQGGSKLDRVQTPLLFFLELLAILLLVTAAAGPRVLAAKGMRPLVVVLDDSYSMQAGDPDSPRQRAVDAILQELRRGLSYSVRFVLAGPSPQLLGEPVKTVPEAHAFLRDWRASAPSADLEDAIAFAAEVGGERATILVVTDHAPAKPPEEGRVQWWSFGERVANVAFVNAARSTQDKQERCLLEIANLSDTAQRRTLIVETVDTGAELQRTPLALNAEETRRVTLNLRAGSPALRARLDDDALGIDNQVVLLPEAKKETRVAVRIRDQSLRESVEKALRAIPGTLLTTTRPALVFTDGEPARSAGAETWTVQFIADKEAEPYAGPFVVDRGHPLSEGLGLQGVVWGGGKSEQLPGVPVVTAGNVPLLADAESLTGRHDIRMRLRLDLSTLHESVDWPVLIWNLVHWRASRTPGLDQANVRLGSDAVLTLEADTESVKVAHPNGELRAVPVHGKRVTLKADSVGVYEIEAANAKATFAANALERAESDLRGCATGRWGNWLDEQTLRTDYQSIAWVLLLLAAAAMGVHLVLIARSRPI